MSRTITTRHRITRASAVALLAAAATLGAAAPALAHDELVATAPVTDADGALEGVTLTFSNSIIEVGTEIVVTDGTGADVTDGEPVVSGPDVTQPLEAGLPEGDYDAAWRVVSSDGHPIEGAFVLAVAADGSAAIEEAPETTGDHEHEAGEAEEHEAEGHEAEGHEHEAGESGESGEAASAEDGGAPAGLLIAVITAVAVVIAGGTTAAVVATRRKREAQAASDGAVRAPSGDDAA